MLPKQTVPKLFDPGINRFDRQPIDALEERGHAVARLKWLDRSDDVQARAAERGAGSGIVTVHRVS